MEKGFSDSASALAGNVVEIDYESPLGIHAVGTPLIALAIGDNHAGLRWCKRLMQCGFNLPTFVHPVGWISPSANLGPGTFIGAGAIVQACVRIGRAGLVNTSAVVDHHADLGAGVHIAPGAILAGNVRVGQLSMVGAGAVIRDRITIERNTVIGAGAVVVRDVADSCVVVGIPAKEIARNERQDLWL